MTDYTLSPKAMLKTVGSSKGAQPKYYENGIWYKENHTGYEGLAEYLCSHVLRCSNASYYVDYEMCNVNGKPGCRSHDFTAPREIFLSFQRLFDLYYGGEFEVFLSTMDNPESRLAFTLAFVRDTTGLDVSDYIAKTLSLDFLTCNPDRHMNNLGVIANQDTGEYRLAPIFDNGAALLSDVGRFPYDQPIEALIDTAIGRPFSSSLGHQALAAGFTLKIDYEKLYSLLEKEPSSRAKDVLRFQLQVHKNIFQMP